jgi:high-affinity nickel permease
VVFGFLALGMIVGMAHALEADHLAAVGTLAAKGRGSRRRLAWLGASWGLGHTTTLLAFSLPVVLLGFVLSKRIEAGLEFGIGVMLVALGTSVLIKMRRQKIHFHLHSHDEGSHHFHAHSHKTASVPHDQDAHDHRHGWMFSKRSYLVGLAHGAAGSAGLVAMAAAATQSLFATLAYVLMFGLGSTLGMAALTLVASWPLRRAESSAGIFHTMVQGGLAGGAIVVGLLVMIAAGPVVLGAS